MKNNKFSIRSRIKSFGFALTGLKTLFTDEHNFRVHLLASIVAIALSFLFQINLFESLAILFAIALVICMETINTCIENLCDLVSLQQNPKIKKIKDMSAALVLISSIAAVIVAILVFYPKIF